LHEDDAAGHDDDPRRGNAAQDAGLRDDLARLQIVGRVRGVVLRDGFLNGKQKGQQAPRHAHHEERVQTGFQNAPHRSRDPRLYGGKHSVHAQHGDDHAQRTPNAAKQCAAERKPPFVATREKAKEAMDARVDKEAERSRRS
jgi:hypothetical protein